MGCLYWILFLLLCYSIPLSYWIYWLLARLLWFNFVSGEMWGNMQGILFIFEGFGRSIMIFLNQVTDAYYICLFYFLKRKLPKQFSLFICVPFYLNVCGMSNRPAPSGFKMVSCISRFTFHIYIFDIQHTDNSLHSILET